MDTKTDSVPSTEVKQIWAMVVVRDMTPVKVFTSVEKAKAFAFDLSQDQPGSQVTVKEVDADYTGGI